MKLVLSSTCCAGGKPSTSSAHLASQICFLVKFLHVGNGSKYVNIINYQPNKKVQWDTNFDPTPFLDISQYFWIHLHPEKLGLRDVYIVSIHFRNWMCQFSG